MAKADKKSNTKKEAPTKAKGPKPDYTPKGGLPEKEAKKLQKELEKVKPPIYYRAEPGFSIKEEGADCTWNEASRQLCLDAAQDFLEEYTISARPLIFEFAAQAALCENWKDLNDAEFRYHGGIVTKGSHMKRQRFWKFITYIANGKIPPDLKLRTRTVEGYNGKKRADAIEYLCEQVKAKALEYITNGSKGNELTRIHCTISYWKPNVEWFIDFEAAPHDYNETTMKGYRTFSEWSTHP